MAVYYKSRFLADPIVYVQEERAWRTYTSTGVREMQGSIPDGILAGVEEISAEEAEPLIEQRNFQVEKWETYRAADLNQGPSGLGGWLVLPIIGLFVTAIVALVVTFTNYVPMMNSGTWSDLTAPGVSPLWVPYFVLEFFCTLALFFGSIALLVLLFQKRRILPMLIICFYGFALIVVVVDSLVALVYGAQLLPDPAVREEIGWTASSIVGSVFKQLIPTAIWIPYFLFSVRVKSTFVYPLPAGSAGRTEFMVSGVRRGTFRRRSLKALSVIAGIIVLLVVVAIVGESLTGENDGSLAPPSGSSLASLPPGSLAGVGDSVITQQQFDQRVADFEMQYAGEVPDKAAAPDEYKLFQQDVLEYLITYELATMSADDMKITVTDAEVQTEIDKVLADSFGGDQTTFDEALKAQGITLDQLKKSYRESMLLQKVYDDVTKDVTVPGSDSTLLETRKTEAWQAWIDRMKDEAGVKYADAWKPTATTSTLPE